MTKRRGWKRGEWLVRDEESGLLEYGSNVTRDYYGVLKRKDQQDYKHPQMFVMAKNDPYMQYPQSNPGYVYDTSAYNASAYVYGTDILTPIGPATHLFPLIELGQLPIPTSGFDIAMASYDSVSLNISAQVVTRNNLAFNNDGTIFYFFGGIDNKVHQFTLSTAWDISTLVYSGKSYDASAQDGSFNWGAIKSNGTKMYRGGGLNSKIFQYDLLTPWDISTATYSGVSLDYAPQDIVMRSIAFTDSGDRIYMGGDSSPIIYQYTLSSSWDISTATYAGISYDPSSEDTLIGDIAFQGDGLRMVILGLDNNYLFQYDLASAWNVSTAVYNSVFFDPTSEDSGMINFAITPAGDKLYLTSYTGTIYQYTLGAAASDGIGVWSIGTSFIVN